MPGVVQNPGSHFFHGPGFSNGQPLSPQGYPVQAVLSAQRRPPAFDPYSVQGRVPSSFSENPMETSIYSNQQSPISAHFPPNINTQEPQMQSMAGVLQQSHQIPPFTPTFDPNDPNAYNFDPASYNFGNHYGALEFGMLGHMSSGAAETPPTDNVTPQLPQGNDQSYTTPGTITTNFSSSPVKQQAYMFSSNQQQTPTEANVQPTTSASSSTVYNLGQYSNGPLNASIPHAFTVSQPSNFSSPTMSRSQSVAPAFENPESSIYTSAAPRPRPPKHRPGNLASSSSSYINRKSTHSLHQSLKSPSEIYSSFTEPYPYTDCFHLLIAYLKSRFPPSLTLRIAKALASIRPSFISCTSNLTREDLVFMEKQFQRCLYQYEGSIERCGTPTLVLRRTGEIAAVGLEFSILTRWARDVLLGWEKNRNVNCAARRQRRGSVAEWSTGRHATAEDSDMGIKLEDAAGPSLSNPASSAATSSSTSPLTRGTAGTTADAQYIRPNRNGPPPHRPVFIAELLDDESAVQFYEDFALLAFGDSRGSVKRKGRLLRYITEEEEEESGDGREVGMDDGGGGGSDSPRAGARGAGMQSRAKTIECAYCWTVKRDVFEAPMMIVMNVSLTPRVSLFCCSLSLPGGILLKSYVCTCVCALINATNRS